MLHVKNEMVKYVCMDSRPVRGLNGNNLTGNIPSAVLLLYPHGFIFSRSLNLRDSIVSYYNLKWSETLSHVSIYYAPNLGEESR